MKDMKKTYEKPILKRQDKMVFPMELISNFKKKIVCKQCSSCHGCR